MIGLPTDKKEVPMRYGTTGMLIALLMSGCGGGMGGNMAGEMAEPASCKEGGDAQQCLKDLERQTQAETGMSPQQQQMFMQQMMQGGGGMMGGGMPDMNAVMRMAMAGGSGYPGMQQAPKEDGVTYLCVTDVQITDRKMGKPFGQPMSGQTMAGPKVQQMRMVGHVRQKDLNIPEATPIIQEKISTGIAGLF